MQVFMSVFKRELNSYFLTPIGYVFISAFTALSVLVAVQIGQLVETGRADLWSFFQFHPWLYTVFVPILGMRSWSEDFKSNTFEILMSMPISISHLVSAKFLAGFCVILLALLCTFPLWLAINLLGPVDNGAAIASYFSSALLAGAMLAIANAASAISKNQLVAFVIASLLCFALCQLGQPILTQIIGNAFGNWFANSLADLSLIDRFEAMARGNISLSGLFFFISTILVWLALASLLVGNRRSALN